MYRNILIINETLIGLLGTGMRQWVAQVDERVVAFGIVKDVPCTDVPYTNRIAASLRLRLLCILLALLTAVAPAISLAASLHDLEHIGQDAAHVDDSAPHVHADLAVDSDGITGEDDGDARDAFHELAHSGHCCANGAAITTHSSNYLGERRSIATPRDSFREPAQSAPIRPFRPPIAD